MAASFQKRSPGLGTARKRDWEKLKESTRKRYQRYGVTPSYYERGGSLQRARGHLPHEHITRRERNPEGFTSTDYRFLLLQQQRNSSRIDRLHWQPFIDFYRSLSNGNRELMRKRVYDENKAYVKRKRTILRNIGEYVNELRNAYPWFKEDYVALMFYH